MFTVVRTSLISTAFVFAITVSLVSPASADHWRGHSGMVHPHSKGYHAHHPGMQGHGGCPYMDGKHALPAMSGKTLGVRVSDLPDATLDEASLHYGINVESVQPDSAAAAAGIRAGDVIAEFAGKPVYSAERLRWLVRKAPPGKGVDIKLMREGKPLVVSATLTEPAPKEKSNAMPNLRQGT